MALADQFSRSIHAIDHALFDIKQASNDLHINSTVVFQETFNRSSFRDLLLVHLARLPHAVNAGIANAQGQIVVSAADWPTPKVNVADRDYFQEARSHADARLSISLPIYSRTTGRRAIVFAQRIENESGDFAGLIFCGVGPEYFEELDAGLQSLHSHRFVLRKLDGSVLIGPPTLAPLWATGAGERQTVSQGATSYRSREEARAGTVSVSVQNVADYPLLVAVAISR